MNPWEMYGGQTEEQPKMPWEMFAAPQNIPSQGDDMGAGKAFGIGLAGGQIPFANRVTSGMGALIAKAASPFTGDERTVGELYDQAQANTKATQEAHPYATVAGNLTGIASTLPIGISKAITGQIPTQGVRGTVNAIPKAVSAVGNYVRGGAVAKSAPAIEKAAGLFSRGAKAATVAAPGAFLYGAGDAESGKQIEGGLSSARVASVAGPAFTVAGAGLNALNNKLGKTFVPTSEEVRAKASSLFQRAEQSGGTLKPEISDRFYDKVLSIKPQTLEGTTFKGESPVTKILDNIPVLKGRPMTLQAAQEVDEALGDLAYSTMDNFGKLSSDGKKFLDMQGNLRRMIEDADEGAVIGGKAGFDTLKEARKVWSTSLRMREIERIIQKAEGKEQPVTVLKNGFNTLLNRGDKLKGYTPAEVSAIQKAAKTGVVTDLVKLAGSGLVPIGSGVAGLSGGPMGGALGAAGGFAVQQGAKALGVARQSGRANDALKTVAERSGMVSKNPLRQIPENLRTIMLLPPKEAKEALKRR